MPEQLIEVVLTIWNPVCDLVLSRYQLRNQCSASYTYCSTLVCPKASWPAVLWTSFLSTSAVRWLYCGLDCFRGLWRRMWRSNGRCISLRGGRMATDAPAADTVNHDVPGGCGRLVRPGGNFPNTFESWGGRPFPLCWHSRERLQDRGGLSTR